MAMTTYVKGVRASQRMVLWMQLGVQSDPCQPRRPDYVSILPAWTSSCPGSRREIAQDSRTRAWASSCVNAAVFRPRYRPVSLGPTVGSRCPGCPDASVRVRTDAEFEIAQFRGEVSAGGIHRGHADQERRSPPPDVHRPREPGPVPTLDAIGRCDACAAALQAECDGSVRRARAATYSAAIWVNFSRNNAYAFSRDQDGRRDGTQPDGSGPPPSRRNRRSERGSSSHRRTRSTVQEARSPIGPARRGGRRS